MPRAQPSVIRSEEDGPPPPRVGLDVGVEFGDVDVGKADAGGVSGGLVRKVTQGRVTLG